MKLSIKTLLISIGAIILVFVITIMLYRQKMNNMRREFNQRQIEYILQKDKEISELLKKQELIIDSLIIVEKQKYDSLQQKLNLTKKEYEKIRNNYSDIVIERPDY